MLISDVSVRRPVFATVISLVLVILGVLALGSLPIREYPLVEPSVISVSTTYRGASSDIIERRVTQVIEDEIAGIAGVEKLTSSSKDEISTINIEFSLDRDPDGAANDVRERISRILGRLPEEADTPRISKQSSEMDASMYVDVASDTRSIMELTDYAERNLVDRLSVINGVGTIRLIGGQRMAMRIWIDSDALAARWLTVQDVEDALRRENVELPAGRIESTDREFTLRTDTGLRTVDDFRSLVIARNDENLVIRLGDVATLRIEPESARRFSRSNGIPNITLAVIPQSQANILAVNTGITAELGALTTLVPDDITISINIDYSVFIRESMREVLTALGISLALVLVVIFLFLGTFRATLIPAVTIPISLIASGIVMAYMGYSINTLTLLGMVLGIGLVVDDAIVVLENIVRRMEQGQPPLLAAIDGSREIGFAVIATTVVLIAVFIPMSFMPGKVGRLFGEFGISLAAAVGFSSLVALTLVPMLASKFFTGGIGEKRLAVLVNRFLDWLIAGYRKILLATVVRPWIAVVLLAGITGAGAWLFSTLPTEHAPTEDRGVIAMLMTAPEGATPNYMDRQIRKIENALMHHVTDGHATRVVVRSGGFGEGGDVNTGFGYMPLVPWKDRDKSAMEIASQMRREVGEIPGLFVFVVLPASLGIRVTAQPLQIVLGGTNYDELVDWQNRIIGRVRENPNIIRMRSDYSERKPKIKVAIDRNRASDLGISLSSVGRTLETMLGSRIVTTFIDRGEEYNVLIQAEPSDRSTVADLQNIYVRSQSTGQLIPLANLVELEESAGPIELKRFNRLRSVKLSAALAPGYSLGAAIDYMQELIAEELPEGVSIGYDGESREFTRSGDSIYFTFVLALVIAFLVLAAQFESFRHPLIIMFTIPMAIFGGLIGLKLLDSSINVFSQIGAIMLIGLAAKNGILIVEFANQLRDRGVEFIEAIVSAATTRFRPVVMTSLCTAGGAVPLILAFGAGAEARRTLGAVVFFGVTVSVVLTLFLIPSFYALMARSTKSPEHVTRMVAKLKEAVENK